MNRKDIIYEFSAWIDDYEDDRLLFSKVLHLLFEDECTIERLNEQIDYDKECIRELVDCNLKQVNEKYGMAKDGYKRGYADAVRKMQEMLNQKIDRTINVFDFQISECNAIRQALRGVKNDINQVAKELLED